MHIEHGAWLLLALLSFTHVSSSSAWEDSEALNIFVVPHSHDDTGWLRTVDEYYEYEVEYIISGVVNELAQNPTRKFIQVEIAFFRMWWNDQTPEKHAQVKDLVQRGQLKFVLAGECMPDEAGTTYEALTHLITSGHAFVAENFGPEAVPNISWHIDPFGHSSSLAGLWAEAGFKGHVLNRVDYRVKEEMFKEKSLEFFWEPTPSTRILTHVLDSHYCTPDGFDWEHGVTQDLPAGDGPPPVVTHAPSQFTKTNANELAFRFIDEARNRSQHFRTPNLLIPFGCDFNFQNARMKFFNMDKLIRHINENSDIFGARVQYSTLDDYFAAVESYIAANDIELPVVGGAHDYFPYSDGPVPWIPEQQTEGNQAYWTGFYTSRAEQKGYARRAESELRLSETLLAIAGLTKQGLQRQGEIADDLALMRQEVGIFQHHDAVTGTERQHVYEDYQARLDLSLEAASRLEHSVLADFASAKSSNSSSDTSARFVITNPLGQDRSELVFVGVDDANAAVFAEDGSVPPQQITPAWPGGDSIDGGSASPSHPYSLVFEANVAASSYVTYKLGTSDEVRPDTSASEVSVIPNDDGHGVSVRSANGDEFKVRLLAYHASENKTQPSGAYILRWSGNGEALCDGKENVTSIKGKLVHDTWVLCEQPAYALRIRHRVGTSEIEVAHSIGPIPESREIVMQYDTSVANGRDFETDTNALRLMQRTRVGTRPKDAADKGVEAAGNFYPVNSGIVIANDDGSSAAGVLVGRAVAGSSLKSGQIDLLLHRRLAMDDYRGVQQALNDTTIVNGRHMIVFGTRADVCRAHRALSASMRHPLQALKSSGPLPALSSRIINPLPENLMLVSLYPAQDLPPSDIAPATLALVVRVLHTFGPGEHPSLSKDAVLDFRKMFPGWKTMAVDEYDLGFVRHQAPHQAFTLKMSSLSLRTFKVTLQEQA